MTFVSSAVRWNSPLAVPLDPSRDVPTQARVIARFIMRPFQQRSCDFGTMPDSPELFGEDSNILS